MYLAVFGSNFSSIADKSMAFDDLDAVLIGQKPVIRKAKVKRKAQLSDVDDAAISGPDRVV
jgi:hypothetical protein